MSRIGRILMTLSALGYAVAPVIVDLFTDTHVFNPGWVPHARLHTVWLIALMTGVGALALALLWRGGADDRLELHVSGGLSALVYGAFFTAALTASAYGGSLADQGGVEPGPFGLDANLFAFSVWSAVLAIGWTLEARVRRRGDG